MHWGNNTAQLVNVDGDTAGAIIPCCLRTQLDDASTMLRTLESVLRAERIRSCSYRRGESNHELVRRRLRSSSTSFPCLGAGGGAAAAAGRAERLHLLWSCCVWLTVRGQGGKSAHSE